jgi:hypothetical protein
MMTTNKDGKNALRERFARISLIIHGMTFCKRIMNGIG